MTYNYNENVPSWAYGATMPTLEDVERGDAKRVYENGGSDYTIIWTTPYDAYNNEVFDWTKNLGDVYFTGDSEAIAYNGQNVTVPKVLFHDQDDLKDFLDFATVGEGEWKPWWNDHKTSGLKDGSVNAWEGMWDDGSEGYWSNNKWIEGTKSDYDGIFGDVDFGDVFGVDNDTAFGDINWDDIFGANEGGTFGDINWESIFGDIDFGSTTGGTTTGGSGTIFDNLDWDSIFGDAVGGVFDPGTYDGIFGDIDFGGIFGDAIKDAVGGVFDPGTYDGIFGDIDFGNWDFGDIFGDMGDGFDFGDIFGDIGDGLGGIWDGISDGFGGIWDGVSNIFGDFDLGDIFGGDSSGLGTSLLAGLLGGVGGYMLGNSGNDNDSGPRYSYDPSHTIQPTPQTFNPLITKLKTNGTTLGNIPVSVPNMSTNLIPSLQVHGSPIGQP